MTVEERVAEITRCRGLLGTLESGKLQAADQNATQAQIDDLKRKIAIHETILGLPRA